MSGWTDRAACRGQPLDAWFPPAGAALVAYERARRVCAACPVRADCLDEDLRVAHVNHRHGMRAGLMPDERDAIARGELTPAEALDHALTLAESEETTVTVTDITPTPPTSAIPATAEALIEWGASQDSSRLQALAGKARGALADLRQAAERETRVAEAEARIERLEAQLQNARQDLAAAKGSKPKAPAEDYAAIRAWAKERGLVVAAVGRPAQTVIDAYHAAQKAA